jgi:signal transduction histidine kinase
MLPAETLETEVLAGLPTEPLAERSQDSGPCGSGGAVDERSAAGAFEPGDLHDGAQARLVAIGMALDAAEQLLGPQPDTVRELLRDARGNSAQALAELRRLVRGIHPPVLADRGLTDAVRALALEAPLPVSVHSDLTGRLPAPVESAAYFTVSELLANVSKHARATSASVRIRIGERLLAVTVADDGSGGADLSAGTGLRGLQRRLAAFDGTLAIDSPLGGPTAITLELPCAS